MRKRAFDLAGALLLFPVATPIILLLMIAIRFETPGSPLFMQRRVGRHRREFWLFKLRTMYRETEHLPSHELSVSKITKIGRILRKTKLDELPQLWNILLGDMSFVGPRPCLPSQDELIAERASRGVYSLRPGITGPAQLAGVDMSTPRELAIADALYMERQTFVVDIRYILLTALGSGSGDAVKD